jgi:hypothetical protein
MQEVGAVVVMYLHPEERQGQVVVEQVRVLIKRLMEMLEPQTQEGVVVVRECHITAAKAAPVS